MTDEHNGGRSKTTRKVPIKMISPRSMRQWTDEEALRFIDFFKQEAPAQYDEYVRQELRHAQIQRDLWLEMYKLGRRVFPGVDDGEIANLLLKARDHVRRGLNLRWE